MTPATLFKSFLSLLASVLLLGGCAPSEPQGPVIFAASSLQKPLEELSDAWQAQGHDPLVFSFASSAALARQIENGSLADIYISADEQWTAYLIAAGPIDDAAIRTVASNGLVLATYLKGRAIPATADGLTTRQLLENATLVTGDPQTVPLGRFARQTLEKEGLWEEFSPHIIPTASSSEAVKLVLKQEADLGILYASDAVSIPDLMVLKSFPAESHDPIRYQALRLPSSAHPDATALLDFLASPQAAAVFDKYGFARP